METGLSENFVQLGYFVFSIFLPLFSQVNVDYTEKMVSISNYPLSAALTCAKITTAFEEVWGVV